MFKRRGRKSAAQTPAPKKERVYGSAKNPVGSAASKKAASKIELSESIVKTLEDKRNDFNDKHPTKKVSLPTLKAVMRRGMGAYSKSHRPTITGGAPNSRQAWGFARVNKFLKKKAGQQVKAAYVQDDDLLKDGGMTKETIIATPVTYKIDDYNLESAKKYLTEWQKERWIKEGRSQEAINNDIEAAEREIKLITERTPFTTWFLDLPKGKYKFSVLNAEYEIKKDVRKVRVEIGWRAVTQNKNFWSVIKTNEVSSPFDFFITNNFEYDSKEKVINHINNNFKQLIYDTNVTKFPLPNNPDIRFKDGGMNKIQLPDTESSYESLQPILARQGYDLKRGLKPTKTVEEIAKKFNTTTGVIEKQLEIGTEHEMEHTYSEEIARNTALHHLEEDHKYYIGLKDMEMRAEAEKLEGYYRSGGALSGETTCEVLDKDGERMIDRNSIENLTECINDLPQTKSMHFDYETNDYKPYRKRLHRDIIYHFKKDLVCVESKQPIAILMGGSPASGKSTFLKKYAPYLLKEEIFKVDADEIRAKLPEYRGYNASQTHLETKDIVNTLLSDRNIGIPCRFDVIYDGTMNNTKSYLPLINLLKREGYKVFIVYIDKVPKNVIVKRALERYKKAGRFVPLEVIDDFFEKGTEALEQLKKQVDGYMVIDGSNQDYKIIEKGGATLPKNRNYSKIGEPITITTEDVVREFKHGGEIDPDDPSTKKAMTHKAGAAGGLLVGNRHSEGGIKAVNKSTGQPLEMEGGEVVITRNAVSDDKKREFEGEMLTNREILSRINQSGGGVAFAEGGDVPERCACSGKKFNYGGSLRSDYEIVREINTPTQTSEEIGFQMYKGGGYVSLKNPLADGELKIPTMESFIKKGQPLESNGVKYIPKLDKGFGSVIYYRNGDTRSKKMSAFDAYRFYLVQQYKVAFDRLADSIKKSLTGR